MDLAAALSSPSEAPAPPSSLDDNPLEALTEAYNPPEHTVLRGYSGVWLQSLKDLGSAAFSVWTFLVSERDSGFSLF